MIDQNFYFFTKHHQSDFRNLKRRFSDKIILVGEWNIFVSHCILFEYQFVAPTTYIYSER